MTTSIKPAAKPSAAPARRGRPAKIGGTRLAVLLMLGPALVAILFFRLVPAFEAIRTSLSDPQGPFAAYDRVFADPAFQASVRQTLLFTVLVNPFQIMLALALAVLLTQRLPLVGLWRTLIFLPAALPQVVSAIIWGVLFRPDGPLNAVLNALGLPHQPFLTSKFQALPGIIILVSWVGVGYWMMFLIAGLKDIPGDTLEAAKIDGAGPLRTFFQVTLPQLKRPLLFVLVADTIANFLVFAPVETLTAGGPDRSTNLIMYDIYERAYVAGDLPAASAETFILLCIILAVVSIQFKLLPSED
ncbi:carbohydrate ABC transporter permease [Streptomyces sp. NEAU-YJ-81]|uniref:carbohydrate ABC transporter permease n=1 Tax=Streptomyces sp. NEAU-YJ-81 TaxID=2820288 RepID=UPI001ABC26A0|nr:sugar ABC transporter permease [Streptomyces sp. NEAU-YJ-81]MBO3681359.1 sugar ABC transporter permease [Streptomyces sp. NEAU-YJ-81]